MFNTETSARLVGADRPAGQPSKDRAQVEGLARRLRETLRGDVCFDDAARALYATDASNYRQVPVGVVLPRDADDVAACVAACREYAVAVLSRGGGTSLAGQCCNTAVVMDMSRYMNRIVSIDPQRRRATVQPGVVLDDLRKAAEKHALTFAPDPSTHDHNTLGGMIGNNSCGVHSIMGGRTSDNIDSMEILLYDGTRMRVGAMDQSFATAGGENPRQAQIHARLRQLRDRYADEIRARFPDIPRRVSGYNLDDLLPEKGFHVARSLVGSESTCVTVLEATVRLVPSPPARVLLVLGYADIYTAGDHIGEIMRHGPIGLEGIDLGLVRDMQQVHLHTDDLRYLPQGEGWLVAEFGADTADAADQRAREVMRRLEQDESAPAMRLFSDPDQQQRIWEIRESALGATAHLPDAAPTWPGWEDSAVPPQSVGPYLRDLRKLMQQHGYACDLYGHFGQGCIHTRIDFKLDSETGVQRYRQFLDAAADLVLSYGGSLSGEHGDGQARGALLERMYGPRLMQAFREFKAIWDPDGMMNPGKVVDAAPPDSHLRLEKIRAVVNPQTRFQFPADHGSFPRALLRCVGVGKCRRQEGGTMCPSYRVTRDESHSTRGRAHLLTEMLVGEVIRDGWGSDAVREALDLCLACKGCKGDCPVSVDMATYKAEFLYHHYQHRRRPRQAYAFGQIDRWARLSAHAPRLVNFLTQNRLFGAAAKGVAGIAPQRSIPRFAPQPFKHWFHARPSQPLRGTPVVLWADTFSNYFHPQIARAAVRVLEAAGHDVLVPRRPLCCGRPLYDFGLLDQARERLREILRVLRPQIASGTPIVGLEPSCVAVFRDELAGLYPDDDEARRLGENVFTLAEFLVGKSQWRPPRLHGKALVHLHCHQKAILDTHSDRQLIERLGLDGHWPDSGCCGLAGSFGFERGKYELSTAIGEQVLMPAVRQADAATWIIADGFSCREQIVQQTGKDVFHLAQVLERALEAGQRG